MNKYYEDKQKESDEMAIYIFWMFVIGAVLTIVWFLVETVKSVF